MANLNIINSLVEKNNITIDQLAEQIGLKRGAIYKMISENSTKIETLEKIAAALNVPTGIFFDDWPGNNDINSENISLKVKRPKIFLAVELDETLEEKVLKMSIGKEFLKMMSL